MISGFFLGVFFCLLNPNEATRCFECSNVPFPRDCTKLITCKSDENCFTEQIITAGGNKVYNSGCLSKSICPQLGTPPIVGKRTININDKPTTDISTCIECCTDDFCNLKGCGAHEIPIEQRGPYCYNCDVLNLVDCNSVAVCAQNELCLMFNPYKLSGLPETIYRGQCESLSACAALTHVYSNAKCTPMCCNTDFCNDHCGVTSNETKTTAQPQTTVNMAQTPKNISSHQLEAVVTSKLSLNLTTESQATITSIGGTDGTTTPNPNAHFHCYGHYIHLRNANAQLCVHIVLKHVTWHNARLACKQEGGDLVVLDTHEKVLLMKSEVAKSDHSAYWIGARDTHQNNHFFWINHHHVDDTEADWANGQPNHSHYGYDQDCVSMVRYSYHWHDTECNTKHLNYICERY
ncbi:uncharacterized protein LOC123530676 isoform X2 [Mercenaria mercenaria]|uniref:uncharacterized protein LOC123530676 isoform X2 n=1 Tax=Mercenaria mercenaria TaxID=6596 RepID=UPI00234EE51C|nr:uncharacterized protein LOC123530676 isoform X2 [Mercenaria mercenaria]